ncbi:hypothetical protein [uncultured Nitratireductor sp.]|uniref:hypothetical protein n=1 Tax=uncultured Nitratireductor sp. TaxID=520953 RepID=UPI0025E394BC|nr:hypothetical protein [uncultured Nitratireductor sp.]
MNSDFSAARVHLERAQDYLRGTDKTSEQARQALDQLIEAVAIAQFTKPRSNVVHYPFGKVARRS